MKRRRLTRANYHAAAAASSPNLARGFPMSGSGGGGPLGSGRPHESSGFPESAGPRNPPMPPPPRPPPVSAGHHHWDGQSPHTSRAAAFDESLRLPPLQTSFHRSQVADAGHTNTPITGLNPSSSSRAANPSGPKKSIAEQVMDIPVPNKLAVLSRVCQEQPSRSPQTFESGTRGAVIAVDGPDSRTREQVGRAVDKALRAVGRFDVRAWENHTAREVPDGEEFRTCDAYEPIDRYSDTVKRWRDKSDEIRRHVSLARSRHGSAESGGSDDSRGKTTAATGTTPLTTTTPVALLSEGYSLTVSDMFACNAPIDDLYEPHDHWQWAATLWRKIIAPDLVVYAMPTRERDVPQYVTVHARNRPVLMVVRIPAGSSLDEATERRVAFEVVEWARRG